MPVNTFRDLFVWQKAVQLVTQIYITTKSFPKDETYGLSSQIRRAAVSMPSNIAEGFSRSSSADFARFLEISIGSLFEVQTQLQIALNLKYINQEAFNSLYESSREIERMLIALKKSIKEKKKQK